MNKKGTKRKRHRYTTSSTERKNLKIQLKRDKHKLKPPCCITCKKNCIQHIPEHLRVEINRQYWTLSKKEQKLFVVSSIERKCVQYRRGVTHEKKKELVIFLFIEKLRWVT